ncbi:MAG: helix-turn-helix domain-containing protein [Pseudomonadota bacterium]
METLTTPTDKLLTRSQVEARYGITKRYLEIAVVRGDGPPYIKLGRSVRYRPSDLDAWIAAQRVDPRAGLRNAAR